MEQQRVVAANQKGQNCELKNTSIELETGIDKYLVRPIRQNTTKHLPRLAMKQQHEEPKKSGERTLRAGGAQRRIIRRNRNRHTSFKLEKFQLQIHDILTKLQWMLSLSLAELQDQVIHLSSQFTDFFKQIEQILGDRIT